MRIETPRADEILAFKMKQIYSKKLFCLVNSKEDVDMFLKYLDSEPYCFILRRDKRSLKKYIEKKTNSYLMLETLFYSDSQIVKHAKKGYRFFMTFNRNLHVMKDSVGFMAATSQELDRFRSERYKICFWNGDLAGGREACKITSIWLIQNLVNPSDIFLEDAYGYVLYPNRETEFFLKRGSKIWE